MINVFFRGLDVPQIALNESVRDIITREERSRELRMAKYGEMVAYLFETTIKKDQEEDAKIHKRYGENIGFLGGGIAGLVVAKYAVKLIPHPLVKIIVGLFISLLGPKAGEKIGEQVSEAISPHLPIWLCPTKLEGIQDCVREIFKEEIDVLTALSAEVDRRKSFRHITELERDQWKNVYQCVQRRIELFKRMMEQAVLEPVIFTKMFVR